MKTVKTQSEYLILHIYQYHIYLLIGGEVKHESQKKNIEKNVAL